MMPSPQFSHACRKITYRILRLYRATVSPDHGFFGMLYGVLIPWASPSGCRFFPSCSAYAEDAIRQYGLVRGSMVSCARILRCHPWSHGGYDPVRMKRAPAKK